MSSITFKLFIFQLIALACGVSAQQFAGTPINNSLAAVPTSEVTYWNINDASNKSTTLINYSSLSKSNARLNTSQVERAVIIVHGLDRDPWNYMSEAISALQNLTGEANVNQNTVQMVAPYFTSGSDKGIAYPWNASAPAGGRGSYTNVLVWYGSYWINGANNQYPYKQQTISSYAVLDTMIQYFDNKALYPNLKQIVLAGHSAGAQTLQRYAAVGNVLNTATPVSLWIANPDSYLWFSDTRPLDTSDCPTYDVWRDGLSNYTNTYGASLVAQGRSAVLARYNARQINYARGTLDTGEDSSTCAPFTTGANRNERFFQFIKAFPPTCTKGACDTIDYVPVGHDAGMMMSSAAGQSRLFLDNWNGNGSLAYDVGCPRLQAGDNPWPNPKCTKVATPADSGTYSGYTYVGCYSDAAFYRSLPYTAYSQNSNATVKTCVAACAAANYTLAGAEFGDECYCGNSMYWATSGPLPEESCTMNCTGIGNDSQICGDSARLSVFSKNNKTPVIATTPVAPAAAKGWAFEGCYTELASGGRSLSGQYFQSTAMTVEMCVSYCSNQGYTIAGAEYAAQCYCGTYLPTGANATYTPECNMPCSGNATEFCGGPGLLSIYANPTYWGTNLTVNVSSSITSTVSTTTTAAALVSATGALSCPGSNGYGYTSGGSVWAIECYGDRAGSDLALAYTSTLESCISTCASTSGCVDISWVPGSASTSPCYLKSAINALQTNNAVWGARYYGRATTSATTSSGNWTYTTTTSAAKNTSMTTTVASTTTPSSTITSSASVSSTMTSTSITTSTVSTSYIVAATPVSCPAANNETYTTGGLIFLMECYTDRPGGDISMQYTASYSACADVCANTTGCIDVSWVAQSPTGPCYMKSQVNQVGTNTAVWGARVIGTATAATSSSTASTFTNSTTSAKTSSVASSSSSSKKTSSSSKIANSTTTASTLSTSSSKVSSSTLSSPTSSVSSKTSSTSSTFSTTTSTTNTTTSTSKTSSKSATSTKTSSTETSSKTSSSLSTSKSTSIAKTTSTTSKKSTSSKTSTTSTISATATIAVRQSYSNWTMQGCYSDNSTHVALPKNVTVLDGSSNMTIPNCLSACAKANYTWCGAENSTLCYGANSAPSATFLLTPTASPVAAGCNVACSGNKTEVCGGVSQLIVYKS